MKGPAILNSGGGGGVGGTNNTDNFPKETIVLADSTEIVEVTLDALGLDAAPPAVKPSWVWIPSSYGVHVSPSPLLSLRPTTTSM